MTTDDRAVEKDLQAHEAAHPGCNERYWRERALKAERDIIGAIRRAYADCEEIIDYSYGGGSGVEAVLELLHRHRDKVLGLTDDQGRRID